MCPLPDHQSSSGHHLHRSNAGNLGEQLVIQWLRQYGGQILAHQWHSRWGELDIVAQRPVGANPQALPTLLFIEVKTRRQGNWDADGRLAITPQKQTKLWKTAQLFLAKHPELGEHPCRFDVALVQCHPPRQALPLAPQNAEPWPWIVLNTPVSRSGYTLTLSQYLQGAFSG